MIDFSSFDAVLREAEKQNRPLTFWWRDDDAAKATPALDRLLGLSARHDAPLAVAAVPALLKPSLAPRLKDCGNISVLVHGHAHVNHAPPEAKKAEFGPHRPLDIMAAEAARSLGIMREVFPETTFAPVFVPPWNRIAPGLAPLLPPLGYAGLSTFTERKATGAAPGLVRINTHLDPVDWHGGRGLIAPAALVASLAEAALRRLQGETAEPLGLLTHHLVHDEDTWRFCETLIARIQASPAARFADIRILLRRVDILSGSPEQSETPIGKGVH